MGGINREIYTVFTKSRIAGIPKAMINKHGEKKGSIIVQYRNDEMLMYADLSIKILIKK